MGNVGSVQCQIVPCSGLYLFLSSIGVPQMHSLSINCWILICCACHFQSGSPFFIYFGFLCLQVSSISNLCPDTRMKVATYLGSLVQFCCGEGGILQTNTTGMCGESLQWMDHTGFATDQGGVYFLGPHCSGSRVLCKGTVPSGPCISCTSQV